MHRTNCVNSASLRTEPERLIPVEWAPTAKSSYLVAIQVEALDRNRLLSDITRALSDQHVNILSAGLNTSKDRICRAKFTFETADPTHLDHVLRAVRSVPGRLRRLPHQPVTSATLRAARRALPIVPIFLRARERRACSLARSSRRDESARRTATLARNDVRCAASGTSRIAYASRRASFGIEEFRGRKVASDDF